MTENFKWRRVFPRDQGSCVRVDVRATKGCVWGLVGGPQESYLKVYMGGMTHLTYSIVADFGRRPQTTIKDSYNRPTRLQSIYYCVPFHCVKEVFVSNIGVYHSLRSLPVIYLRFLYMCNQFVKVQQSWSADDIPLCLPVTGFGQIINSKEQLCK